jgi:gluconate 2-dehydrogenase gamma chain
MMMESALSRREILKRLGIAGVAVALPELSRVLLFQRDVQAQQRQPASAAAQPQTLSPADFATLTAICARIIPTDASGPGATEARASHYIDGALGGWLAPSREAYSAGLVAVDEAAVGRYGRRFIELSEADQDGVLTTLEQTPFFALVRTHTIQGTFCDPAYGGNANFIGWNLIGYPGVRLAASADDQRMASPPKPMRRSAYDYAMFSAMGATHAH